MVGLNRQISFAWRAWVASQAIVATRNEALALEKGEDTQLSPETQKYESFLSRSVWITRR